MFAQFIYLEARACDYKIRYQCIIRNIYRRSKNEKIQWLKMQQPRNCKVFIFYVCFVKMIKVKTVQVRHLKTIRLLCPKIHVILI